MNVIRRAINTFFSEFCVNDSRYPDLANIPAHQAGFVPDDAPFPYITYELVKPEFLDFAVITASIYDREPRQHGYMALVDDVLGQMAEKVPVGGCLLDCGSSGKIWLLRSNPFLSYLDDPVDRAVTRGIARFIDKSYMI